ncbi:MAG TPA: DUF6252 family protein [Bacteroidia bacterium]|nr:DUF6252 family protein [Bacteroidia bacterium]
MKVFTTRFAFMIMAGLAIASCKKSTVATPTPAPATTSTTPSFVATVSGTAYTFTGTAAIPSSGNSVGISGVNMSSYTIMINDLNPVVGTVAMNMTSGVQGSITQISTSKQWSTGLDNTHTGTLTLTTFDRTKKTCSGTFSFSALESPGTGSSSITITNGSFSNIKWN